MKKLMGPYTHFGIIDNYDEKRDYSKLDSGITFREHLENFNCVPIPDDLINDWWESLLNMKVIPFGYPPIYTTALNRWGTTIIPPESLPLFIKIIKSKTSMDYKKRDKKKLYEHLTMLITLLQIAHKENKYVIHYGV